MNLDVVPDNVLERLAMTLGVVPSPVVRVLWGVAIVRIVLPALDLGIFDAIDEGATTPEDIAKKTSCDVDGMRSMLAALNGFGFLMGRSGQYSLTSSTKKWMTAGAKNTMKPALQFAATLDEMMQKIPESVRTGKRGGIHEEPHPPEWWRRYMEGLGAIAKITGVELARRVKLDAPKKLLDVGGGHGGYSVAFCKKHPSLQATVLDLPEAARVGRDLVAREEMSERITYLDGDLRKTEWGEGYDVVFLFNILHNLTEDECKAALKKARAAGKMLLILDGERASGDGNLNAAEGFGELFFFSISASMTWPDKTLREWCHAAGFESVKRMKLFTFPSSICLVCR
jgi:2-hydroxy-4-(methylsulfanyl)butanoate S-methyltransferase